VTKPFSPELKNEISLSENHTENNWFSCPVNATVHAESQFSRRWQSYDKTALLRMHSAPLLFVYSVLKQA